MGHHERRKRSEFLTDEEIKALFLYEFESEFSKNCATEFDKRLKYVFEVPEILEKAWKMPWKLGWKEELKPVLMIYGDNLDIFDGNSRIEELNAETEALLAFHPKWNLRNKPFDKKDWRDFK